MSPSSAAPRRSLRVRLKPADPFDLIRLLARSQNDPRKAAAELVQNSLDAGAGEVTVTRFRYWNRSWKSSARSRTAWAGLRGSRPSVRRFEPMMLKTAFLAGCLTFAAQESDLRKAVTFYASFDASVAGDFGGGELALSTRSNSKTEKGALVFEKGYSEKAFRIAAGVSSGVGKLRERHPSMQPSSGGSILTNPPGLA